MICKIFVIGNWQGISARSRSAIGKIFARAGSLIELSRHCNQSYLRKDKQIRDLRDFCSERESRTPSEMVTEKDCARGSPQEYVEP